MRFTFFAPLFAMTAGLMLSASIVRAEEPTGEELVNALQAVFGEHKGTRRGHAKGFCIKGDFLPNADAASITTAVTFTKPAPFFGRFSLGGGNPELPDTAKGAARGFALRIDPQGDQPLDLVLISAPVHFAKSGEQMLQFLKLRVKAPGADAPDAEKIKAFADANPETTIQGQWLSSRALPASYASVNYWSVHAFGAVNKDGKRTDVKFKLIPVAGESGLTEDEAKQKSKEFYKAELTERLAKGPASFQLVAIVGKDSDPKDNPTVVWPDAERQAVKLGIVNVTALEDDAVCNATTLDPGNLVPGIEPPAADKIFSLRSAAYAVSLTRRSEP